MKKKLLKTIILLACFVAPLFSEVIQEEKLTKGEQVIKELTSKGIPLADVKEEVREEGIPLPNTYVQHLRFSHKSVSPRGGQIFIFTKPKYAEAVLKYFKALESLAGPYLYKSKDGLIVGQFSSGLNVAAAEKIEEVFKDLKLRE